MGVGVFSYAEPQVHNVSAVSTAGGRVTVGGAGFGTAAGDVRVWLGEGAGAGPDGFPWASSDYRQVEVRLVEAARDPRQRTVLLLHDVGTPWEALAAANAGAPGGAGGDAGPEYMLVEIGGDTAVSIVQEVAGVGGPPRGRPLALDLLWSVLGRGRELSSRDWSHLRTAIVDLQDSVFIGRMFFGDPEGEEALWDCDCRPSDGIWMALKSQRPIYVHRHVWESARACMQKGDLDPRPEPSGEPGPTLGEAWRASSRAAESGAAGLAGEPESLGGRIPATHISSEDPEAIRLLKRELDVALHEEDYAAAARLRDHPYLRLYAEVRSLRAAGQEAEAQDAEARLHALIRAQDGGPEA